MFENYLFYLLIFNIGLFLLLILMLIIVGKIIVKLCNLVSVLESKTESLLSDISIRMPRRQGDII